MPVRPCQFYPDRRVFATAHCELTGCHVLGATKQINGRYLHNIGVLSSNLPFEAGRPRKSQVLRWMLVMTEC